MISNLVENLADKVRRREISKRELEYHLFEIVGDEMGRSELDQPTWLKAFSESEGIKERADALYLKLRVQRLLDLIEAETIDGRSSSKFVDHNLDDKRERGLSSSPRYDTGETGPRLTMVQGGALGCGIFLVMAAILAALSL